MIKTKVISAAVLALSISATFQAEAFGTWRWSCLNNGTATTGEGDYSQMLAAQASCEDAGGSFLRGFISGGYK